MVLESRGKAAEEPRGAVTCLGNVAGILKVLKAAVPSLRARLGCINLFCPLVRLPGQACEPKPFLSETAPFLAFRHTGIYPAWMFTVPLCYS